MSDTDNAAPETFPVLVDEFCTDLSAHDRRPELIYAFSKDEKRKGHLRDTAANFQARFAAFASRTPA
jgi:hypothetical protein